MVTARRGIASGATTVARSSSSASQAATAARGWGGRAATTTSRSDRKSVVGMISGGRSSRLAGTDIGISTWEDGWGAAGAHSVQAKAGSRTPSTVRRFPAPVRVAQSMDCPALRPSRAAPTGVSTEILPWLISASPG